MKHYKKKELLKTVSTLEKANDTIIKSIRTNPSGAAEALALCQESAIVMGTCIETLDEKYAYLVRLLEDYCENIFRMSEAVPDETQCRKTAKKIKKQLSQLRHGITYDLPDDRKEVVFLPYKACMWDSLESVWKAADADENTDAYVIPIPYFDKNPDGTFREMHYEGDQYPKNVPITHYEEYDLETCRPDVIYIHNPYDECNHVTSVHPYFYSKNLKTFTDRMVYIPYFILREIDPNNQAAIDDMKHFCFLPGTIYADQVIVQSENMRQIYTNEYIKAAKAAGLGGGHVDRRFLEKKFLGTGSPKIDKMLRTKKEDLEVPPEWLPMIEKPDGNRKKIVFYNTSVSALLHNDEKMLRKMESVFEIFKENQDKVALLWRPHPLIQATIGSMRPRLWEEYRRIRDRYIEEGWGIYDSTADLDRAVVIADAYYGDESSVVELCREKGLDILIQNPAKKQKLQDMTKIPIWFEDCVQIENYIWFSANDFNGLCRLNIATGKTEYIAQFPNEYQNADRLYTKIYRSGNKLIFMPHSARNIAVYGLDSEKLISISLDELEDTDLEYEDKYQFVEAYNESLYFFDIFAGVIKMNITTGRLSRVRTSVRKKGVLFDKHARVANKVYGVFIGSNSVYIFDLETETCEVKSLHKKMIELQFCFHVDCDLYFGTKNSLFQCNESLNGWREVYSESGAEWINGYYDQRVFFLCDTNQKKVSVIDENGRKIHTLSGKKEDEYEYSRWQFSLWLNKENDNLKFIDLNTHSLLIVNLKEQEMKSFPIYIEKADLAAQIGLHHDLLQVRNHRQAMGEGTPGYLFTLDNWLEAVIEKSV